ncbi:hypothetical protein rosag_25090 [Roseisolibacter agri]|uniref:Uncharacterized protein n=1 Tax=Roseisolibacter agri TaxID=2014610 RepID=A0AA37QAB0_9BACT|nr:hypothetical protein rosag_25090 [Roseisolibacter agri]
MAQRRTSDEAAEEWDGRRAADRDRGKEYAIPRRDDGPRGRDGR